MGTITRALPTEPGKRTDRTSPHNGDRSQKTKREILKEAGIDPKHSDRNETLAEGTEEDFDKDLEENKKTGELTTAKVIQFEKKRKMKNSKILSSLTH